MRERPILLLLLALLAVSLGLALKDPPRSLSLLFGTRLHEALAFLRMAAGSHGALGLLSQKQHRPAAAPPPPPPRAPFGAILGVTDGGVAVYSCNYDDVSASSPPQGDNYWEGHWTGTRFQ